MESVTRNVRDISQQDRLVLEHVIGHQLAENQQVTFQVCDLRKVCNKNNDSVENGTALPQWCNVYAGLDESQIAALEDVILLRANLTRVIE